MSVETEVTCPVCAERCAIKSPNTIAGEYWTFSCKRCGRFHLSPGVSAQASAFDHELRAKVSGYLREETDLGADIRLNNDLLARLVAQPLKSVPDRIRRLLNWCVRQQGRLDSDFVLGRDASSASYSSGLKETYQLVKYLIEKKWITKSSESRFAVTIDGFVTNEQNSNAQSASSQAFVAMWFDPKMQTARETGLSAGIVAAGYDPIFVNDVEHVNKIDDEIISQIRKSRFLVADFTGHRGGVYFEAGFAMGLGLPVFWTCQKDDLEKLHFDIRQYNCIDWSEPNDLAMRLTRRIEAIIGPRVLLSVTA